MSVLAYIALAADVNPVVGAGFGCAFEDQLICIDVVHEPCEPRTEFLLVGEVNVTGFAFHVLAGLAAAHGCIELGTTVAGTYDERLANGK